MVESEPTNHVPDSYRVIGGFRGVIGCLADRRRNAISPHCLLAIGRLPTSAHIKETAVRAFHIIPSSDGMAAGRLPPAAAERSRAEQSRAEQSRAEQSRVAAMAAAAPAVSPPPLLKLFTSLDLRMAWWQVVCHQQQQSSGSGSTSSITTTTAEISCAKSPPVVRWC